MARHRFPVEQFGPMGPVGAVTVRIGLTKGSRRPPLEIFEEARAATTNSAFEGFLGTMRGGVTFTTGAVLVVPLPAEAFCLPAVCLPAVCLSAVCLPAVCLPAALAPVAGAGC